MKVGRRQGVILAAACVALLASILLVGQLRSTGGSVELGEDGKWYDGTFIPRLDYSRRGATSTKRPISARPSLEIAAQKLIGGGASSKRSKLEDLPIPNLEPGTDSTPDYPLPEARHRSWQGVGVGAPMADSAQGRQMMLEDKDHNYAGEESFVTDEDWDNSAALEKAGINVHKGFESKKNDLFGDHVMTKEFATVHPASGAPIFYDRNVPVEEADDTIPKAMPGTEFGRREGPFDVSPATEYPTDAVRAETKRIARAASRSGHSGADESGAAPPPKSSTHGGDGLDMHHDGGAVPHSSTEPAGHLNAIGLKGKESQLWQVAQKKTSKLYVDASSPDYLEPQKHQAVYSAAWKWAAKMRSQKEKDEKEKEEEDEAAEHAPVVELAQLSKPCPWYGCPDGSGSIFARREPVKQQQLARADTRIALAQKILSASSKAESKDKDKSKAAAEKEKSSAGPAVASAEKKVAKIVKRAAAPVQKEAAAVNQALHLAHGYGTTNAYTAKPLRAPKNQYYGGDHSYHGSGLPVNSHEGVVRGDMPHSNDVKSSAYDFDGPTSFDSVPLAESSTFASRVAAHQPAGDGKLEYSTFKGSLLAAWRKYEHGLGKCMQAEATLDPSLKDYSCSDVSTGIDYLTGCMKRHDFGLSQLSQVSAKPTWWRGIFGKTRDSEGAWGAMPKLLAMSRQLSPEDYEQVYSVLTSNAVFSAMWRMENLHTRCVTTGSAYRPEGLTRRNEVRRMDAEIKSMSRSLSRDYPGTEAQRIGEARVQGMFKGAPWEYNAVQRGSARNYWPNVMGEWSLDGTRANLPGGEYYGPETGYEPAPVTPHEATRNELPRWRVPMSDGPNPAGVTGTYGDYIMQQPRAKLTGKGPGFPTNVNGKAVNPRHPRPYQVQSGGLTPYAQHYTWAGPGPYDYVPLASPASLRNGYTYPSTLWPMAGKGCVEDRECGARSVCGSAGICVEWDTSVEPYRAPAQGGSWPTDASPDWV